MELKGLLSNGYVKMITPMDQVSIGGTNTYNITEEGRKLMVKYDNYFIKAKKKTNAHILGSEWKENITKYREFFPAKKLPSGKPARNNTSSLTIAFRWFFAEYDYTWEEIHRATAMYVNAYEDKEYLYMKTSQYFITKADKSKIKYSELADYCDMIKEGVEPDEHNFKENVV